MFKINLWIIFNFIILTETADLIVYDQNFNLTETYFSDFYDIPSNVDILSHGHLIAKISSNDFELKAIENNASFIWKDWGDCYECGESSIRIRSGYCTTDKTKNSNCDSLKSIKNNHIFYQNLTQYQNCFRECNDTDLNISVNDSLVSDELRFLNNTDNNTEIVTFDTYKGDAVKLLCLDRKFEVIKWTKNKKAITRKTMMNRMIVNMARIYVNSYDEVEIKNVLYADAGEYTCLIGNEQVVKIRLVVNKKLYVDKVSMLGSYKSLTLFLVNYMVIVSVLLVYESLQKQWTRKDSAMSGISQEKENKNIKRFIRDNIHKYNQEFEYFLFFRNIE